ncbi:fimbrial protein [Providencia hangzhouensis]
MHTATRKSVQISFNGTTVDGKPGLLANTAGAGSANVGLQLFNPDGSPLEIGALSSKVDLTDTTTIPLSVDYKSIGAVVTAGKVQSVANFMLTYN